MSVEKPIGVAIIICDRVIVETQTNNKTLVSIFNTISSPVFPCRHERLSIFIAFTNGQGLKKISLILRQLSSNSVNLTLSGDIQFPDPNAVIEMIFNLRNVVFAAPGTYAFEVHADGEYIFESRFHVNNIQTEKI
jgi:hypothetical protein